MSLSFEPPTQAVKWPILRLDPRVSREAIITNRKFLMVGTHFVKQTYLCAGNDDCALCSVCLPRSLWYCSAISPHGGKRGFLELSATSSAELEQACRFGGAPDLLGCHVRLVRKGVRKGVQSELLGVCDDVREVSDQEWISPLMFIFGLPPMRPFESVPHYVERTRPIVLKRAEMVAAKIPGFSS